MRKYSVAKSFSSPALQALLLAAALITAHTAQADTLTLSESQKDEVKCGPVIKDPDTGERTQDCHQNTTGSYSVTLKLSEATFINNELLFADINIDSLLNIIMGEFSFSDYFSGADINKLNATVVEGKWLQSHEVCTQYNVDDECVTNKTATDGIVKISRVKNKGATITLSGKSDGGDNGQKLYASLCEQNGSGIVPEDAIIRLNDTSISVPIQITCKVKTTGADPNGIKGGPYDLTNMTIKAKLAPAHQ
jgi:hypothetical protein